MKRIFLMTAMAAALCSCDKKEIDPASTMGTEEGQGKKITVTATMPQSDNLNTKAACDFGETDPNTWKFSWGGSDLLNLYTWGSDMNTDLLQYSLNIVDGTNNGDVADFESIFDLSEDRVSCANYRYLHCSGYNTVQWADDGVTLNLTNQYNNNNNWAQIITSDIFEGPLTDGDHIATNPQLKHATSYVCFNITDMAAPDGMKDALVSSVVISGFKSKTKDDTTFPIEDLLTDGIFDTNENIEVDDMSIVFFSDKPKVADITGENSAKIHFGVLPQSVNGTVDITVVLNNGVSMTKSKVMDMTFERGKFYTINLNDFTPNGDKVTTEYNFEGASYYIKGSESSYTPNYSNSESYNIHSINQLSALATLANMGELAKNAAAGNPMTFTLVNDISGNYNRFTPIGYTDENSFQGTFDGNGHVLKKFTTTVTDNSFGSLGIFGYIKGTNTVVKNVVLENCKNKIDYSGGGTHLGILAGTLTGGATLLNCGCDDESSATLTNVGSVGGLVGYSTSTSGNRCQIINCYNQGSVVSETTTDANAINIGGLCGSVFHTDIKNSYNSGAVTYGKAIGDSSFWLGSLVGNNGNWNAYNCFYLTECAGSGVGAIASGSAGGSTDKPAAETAAKSSTELKALSETLTTNANSITGACAWINVVNGYPIFDLE